MTEINGALFAIYFVNEPWSEWTFWPDSNSAGKIAQLHWHGTYCAAPTCSSRHCDSITGIRTCRPLLLPKLGYLVNCWLLSKQCLPLYWTQLNVTFLFECKSTGSTQSLNTECKTFAFARLEIARRFLLCSLVISIQSPLRATINSIDTSWS